MTMVNHRPETGSVEYQELEDRLIQAARDLRPALIAEQAEVERRTFFSEEMHRSFEEAGFYRMLIPRAHGGLEVNPRTFFRVAREIARGDMSTGWCFTLSANHSLMLANWFPESVHAEIFNGGDFRAASMYAPTVTATRNGDGWDLNGVVNYCSGIPYSTHFIGQARLSEPNPDGSPRFGIYVAPHSEFVRLDDWGDTLGLKGSGSHSIRFENGHIPAAYLVDDADINFYGIEEASPGTLAYGNPIFSGRHMSTFALSLAAVCIGGGFGALDEFEHQMRTRKTTLPPFVLRTEDDDFLRWYGSAFIKLQLAASSIDNVLDQWLELASSNVSEEPGAKKFTVAEDGRLSGVGRELMLYVWEAVEQDLFRTIGASAIKNGQRFEQIFRDLAQAASHRNPQLRDFSFRMVAKQQLGLA